MNIPKRIMRLRLPDRLQALTDLAARYGKRERFLDTVDRMTPLWGLLYSYIFTTITGAVTHFQGIPFDWKVITFLCIFTLATFYLIMWLLSGLRPYYRRKMLECTLLSTEVIKKLTLELERKNNNA